MSYRVGREKELSDDAENNTVLIPRAIKMRDDNSETTYSA